MANRSFKDILDNLLEGIKGVQEEMKEKGLLTDETTFEEMADYAGKHVQLREMSEEEYKEKKKQFSHLYK